MVVICDDTILVYICNFKMYSQVIVVLNSVYLIVNSQIKKLRDKENLLFCYKNDIDIVYVY